MAEKRQKFGVSQIIETSSIKKQVNFLVEKTDKDARITIQEQENGERVLNISVYRMTVEEPEKDKYYKFTINVSSSLKNFKVELTAEILDIDKVGFLLLDWLNWSEIRFAQLIKEYGLEVVAKQLTRDLFSFIKESVGIQ